MLRIVLAYFGGILRARGVLRRQDVMAESNAQTNAAGEVVLPVLGGLPNLDGARSVVQQPAAHNPQLKGKIVLVDFWTYSCIIVCAPFPISRCGIQNTAGTAL